MFIFQLFFLLILVSGITLIVRTIQLKNSPNQSIFREGKVPHEMPDGQYSGTAGGKEGSWLGKKFDQAKKTGINVFQTAQGQTEKYAFRTNVGHGVTDPIQVIKIDYNIPENPWYLRLILDEIVEVAPNAFLGKLQIRVLPDFFITLGFFSLDK